MQKINQKYITSVVKEALLEDLFPSGDLTTKIISSKNKVIKAKIISRQKGVLAGVKFAGDIFRLKGCNVKIIKNKGANLATWNIENYKIAKNEEGILVDDDPLVFFHFHGFM